MIPRKHNSGKDNMDLERGLYRNRHLVKNAFTLTDALPVRWHFGSTSSRETRKHGGHGLCRPNGCPCETATDPRNIQSSNASNATIDACLSHSGSPMVRMRIYEKPFIAAATNRGSQTLMIVQIIRTMNAGGYNERNSDLPLRPDHRRATATITSVCHRCIPLWWSDEHSHQCVTSKYPIAP